MWKQRRLHPSQGCSCGNVEKLNGPTSQFPTQSMEPSDFKPSDRAAPSSLRRHQTHTGHWWSIHRCIDPDTRPGVRLSLFLSKTETDPALSYCSISNTFVLWRWYRQQLHLPVTRCRSHSPTRFTRLTQLTKHCQTWNRTAVVRQTWSQARNLRCSSSDLSWL